MDVPAQESVTADQANAVECRGCGNEFEPRDKRVKYCASCRDHGDGGTTRPVESDSTYSVGEPIRIPVARDEVLAPSVPTRLYWVGSIPETPENVHLAGIQFPKTNGEIRANPDNPGRVELISHTKTGCLVRMTDAQLQHVIERAKSRFVRGGRIYTKGVVGREPGPGDRMLLEFIWIVPVDEGFNNRGATPPPTLAATE